MCGAWSDVQVRDADPHSDHLTGLDNLGMLDTSHGCDMPRWNLMPEMLTVVKVKLILLSPGYFTSPSCCLEFKEACNQVPDPRVAHQACSSPMVNQLSTCCRPSYPWCLLHCHGSTQQTIHTVLRIYRWAQ